MDYNRPRLRFDRDQLLIGTYCLKPYARTEAHIRALKAAHIDFVCATPDEPELLDLLQQHGMGLFATCLPGWGGWLGENAGRMAEMIPLSSYEEAARRFTDHPAVWAVDVGDEPSALDLPHHGKLIEAAYRLFPNQMPYLNLYPAYGAIPQNTPEDIRFQLGTPDYASYIERYLECVDADYLCFDYYMYAMSVESAYANMALVADKCRAAGRDMWIVLQVNSMDPDAWISLPQLRHQAYAALSFGARCINWACWTAGWWHNNVLDAEGNATQQYGKVRQINGELKAVGAAYMRYRNRSTARISAGETASLGRFRNIETTHGIFAGHMTDPHGREALMITDISDPYGRSGTTGVIRFRCSENVRALRCGEPMPLRRTGDIYEFDIAACEGVLLMQEDNT